MQLRSSFILYIHLLHSGGVGGGDGIPEQERSCFKSLYISKISLPVHNFSIMMLLMKIKNYYSSDNKLSLDNRNRIQLLCEGNV